MRVFIFILIAVVFFGCTSPVKMNKLQLGMTKEDVIGVMGEPNSTSAMDNVMYLKYRFHNEGVFLDDYYVKLKDGKVQAFGLIGEFGQGY